jgi:hypothetical protein
VSLRPDRRRGLGAAIEVAPGRAVVLLPASLRDQIRRDVLCVPVRDSAPSTLLIAWPSGRRSPALASFVRTATKVAAAASNAA